MIKTENKIKWLSHTSLEMMNRCKRCFWLKTNKKIYQPEGIVSRLANRFDTILKEYFNSYRSRSEVPPIIKDKIKGKLQNPFKEIYYYRVNEKYGFYGKLDDCVVDEGIYAPIDFKTTSSDPALFDSPNLEPKKTQLMNVYKNQIEEYVFLMEQNRLKTGRLGYLVFFYPDTSHEIHNGFPMKIDIKKISNVKPENVLVRINKAIEISEGQLPDPAPDCPFCNWFYQVKNYY